MIEPKAGLSNSLLNKLLTVCISVYVDVSLSVDAGDLAPRGRSEPEHQLPEMGFTALWVKRLLFHSRAVAPCTGLYFRLLLVAPQGTSRRLAIRTEQWGEGPWVPDR